MALEDTQEPNKAVKTRIKNTQELERIIEILTNTPICQKKGENR